MHTGHQYRFGGHGPLVLRALAVVAGMLMLTDGPPVHAIGAMHASGVIRATSAIGATHASGTIRATAAIGATRATAQTAASRFALAIVSDGRGKALVDIGADDFVVEESGTAREILDVRVADYPIAVVIDNGSGARADFTSIRAAVARFIERLGPRPVILVTTAPAPTIVATLEDERSTVLSRLDAIDPPVDSAAPSLDPSTNAAAHPAASPSSATSATASANGATDAQSLAGQPLGAASLAASTIHATGALFSSVIVVTASAVEVAGSAADALVAPIVDSGAVVHVVARGAEGSAAPASRQLFRDIAQQMHGDFTPIYAAPSYQPALDRLATRLTTELMVEYIVPAGSKAADVKIGVRIPGARVRGLGVAPR